MKRTRYTLLLVTLSMVLSLAVNADSVTSTPAPDKVVEQTICPVMEGNPINKDLHVDYKGKRVYFCCNMCVGAFQKNPEKYLAKLPQFQSPIPSGDPHEGASHGHGPSANQPNAATGFRPYTLVAPMGIATFTALLLTVLTGVFRRKLKKRFMVVHKVLAFLTLILAALHALLVLVFH